MVPGILEDTPESSEETLAAEYLSQFEYPWQALAGLGENAAANIVAARDEEPFFSVEDLQIRAKLTKSVIEVLRNNKVLEGLDETDQLSFF